MWYEDIAKIGGLIVLFAHLPIYIGIVRKTIKPKLSTWGMWSVMLSATLATQVFAGKEDPWGMLAATTGTILVFILLLYYGERCWTKFDTKCLLLSAMGFIIWMIAGPALGQIAFLSSLMMAGAPTVKNAWENPQDESSLAWGTFTLGFFLTMMAVQDWSWLLYIDWIQPVTSTLFNFIVFVFALFKVSTKTH